MHVACTMDACLWACVKQLRVAPKFSSELDLLDVLGDDLTQLTILHLENVGDRLGVRRQLRRT